MYIHKFQNTFNMLTSIVSEFDWFEHTRCDPIGQIVFKFIKVYTYLWIFFSYIWWECCFLQREPRRCQVHFVGQPQNSLITCYAIQFSFTRCKSVLSRGNRKYFVVNTLRSRQNDSYFVGYNFQCISRKNISCQIPDDAFAMLILIAKAPLMPLALLPASLLGQLMLMLFLSVFFPTNIYCNRIYRVSRKNPRHSFRDDIWQESGSPSCCYSSH